jgi:hypothetical protein
VILVLPVRLCLDLGAARPRGVGGLYRGRGSWKLECLCIGVGGGRGWCDENADVNRHGESKQPSKVAEVEGWKLYLGWCSNASLLHDTVPGPPKKRRRRVWDYGCALELYNLLVITSQYHKLLSCRVKA